MHQHKVVSALINFKIMMKAKKKIALQVQTSLNCQSCQEIFQILWHLKVCYQIQESLLPVSVLSQIKSITSTLFLENPFQYYSTIYKTQHEQF